MRILKEAKYEYLRDKARRNRNYTLIASLPIFIFVLLIIQGKFSWILPVPPYFYILYLAVPSFFLRKYLNYKKGIRGEKEVTTALQKLNDSYYLLNDVVLYPKVGNVDHIVLGQNGLFVIETKNYKGEISCYGDKWQHHYDEISYPLSSISKQAKRNAMILRRFLEENDHSGVFKNIWVNALVVFVNPHVKLALHKPTLPVLRLFEASDFIKKVKKDERLPDRDLRTLGDVILKNTTKR